MWLRCDRLNCVFSSQQSYSLFCFRFLFFSVSAADREVASETISEAELAMGQAYEAVLDAERVDAEVSGLLVRLNDAAELLSVWFSV